MSYILDALRRADAERALGHAPDLHAQPLPPLAAGEDGPATTARPALWLGAGLAFGVLGALAAWWWFAPAGDGAADTGAPGAATAPAATARVEPAPPPPMPVAEPVATPSPPMAAPALNRLPPLPPPAPPVAGQVPAGTPAEGAAQGAAAAPVEPPRPAQAPAPPKPVDAPVPSWREVSGRLARELPQLAFGGTVYSDQRSARLLLLNGRVFREGETIVPELVVEEIGPRSAVLRFREQRFSLP